MGRRKRGGQVRRRRIERKETKRMQNLVNWIYNVRAKKLECEKKYKLRMAAVLTRTLHNMEYEYRAQQISKVHRQLRQPLKCVENVGIVHNCGLYNAAERRDIEYQQLISKRNNVWQESLCDDLSSLDNFLQQLGQQATMESMESMQSVESVESMESLESMESMEEKSEYFFQS